MKGFALWPALPLFCFVVLSARAAPSFGYVDMQRVLDESQLGLQAQRALQEKFAEPQRKLAQEERALLQLQQKMHRDAALMSREELEKRRREIQQRFDEFQRAAAEVQQALAREQMKLGAKIIAPARRAIAVLAKQKNLQAVFERNQSGLLYVDEGFDLTDAVIRHLDAQEP